MQINLPILLLVCVIVYYNRFVYLVQCYVSLYFFSNFNARANPIWHGESWRSPAIVRVKREKWLGIYVLDSSVEFGMCELV